MFDERNYIKKMKKALSLLLAQIILVLAICTCMDADSTVYAKTKSPYTISISKVDTKVCEKIHKNLSNEKPLTLKVKGNEKQQKTTGQDC